MRFPALRDVAVVGDDGLQVGVVQHALADALQPAPTAVLVADSVFGIGGESGFLVERPDHIAQLLDIVRVHQLEGVHAHHLLRLIAEDASGGRPRVFNRAVGGDQGDAVRAVLDQRPEAALAGLERLFRPLALTDVRGHADQARDFALRAADRAEVDLHNEGPDIGNRCHLLPRQPALHVGDQFGAAGIDLHDGAADYLGGIDVHRVEGPSLHQGEDAVSIGGKEDDRCAGDNGA